MNSRILLSTVLLSLLASCSNEPEAPAKDVASDFYQAYLLADVSGVPNAEQRSRLAPLLSPTLIEALAQAEAAELRYALMNNNSVPPLVQGDLFSSLFEGATGANVHQCKEVESKAACQILLAYEPPGSQPAHWQDILHLVLTDNTWRIDDLEYGGNWPFGNKGSLRATLAQVITQGEAAKPQLAPETGAPAAPESTVSAPITPAATTPAATTPAATPTTTEAAPVSSDAAPKP